MRSTAGESAHDADPQLLGVREKTSPRLWSLRDDQGGKPWGIGWQMNERFISWNSQHKDTLLLKILSRELSLSEEETIDRLEALFVLLPPMQRRISTMGEARVVALLNSLDSVMQALLHLRRELDDCDVAEVRPVGTTQR